jgi:hypothetical protein
MRTKNKPGLNLKSEERFLFENLPDVLSLEAAMEGIRKNYAQFWDDICRRVKEKYPQLNFPCNHATRRWEGQVGIGRESWPSQYANWPSGLYICYINFESLCSRDTEAPCAGIWVQPPQKMRIDVESLREPFSRRAEQKLGFKLLDVGNSDISLWFDLPESRDELLGMLTKNKEVQFADCMVSHFVQLAMLIPEIDKVFNAGKKRRG